MSEKHWLTRPETIKKLWIGGCAILALTVIGQLLVELHPHFTFEGWFAFSAIFGFLSCVAMVLFAKVLGNLLKRKDTFYDE